MQGWEPPWFPSLLLSGRVDPVWKVRGKSLLASNEPGGFPVLFLLGPQPSGSYRWSFYTVFTPDMK